MNREKEYLQLTEELRRKDRSEESRWMVAILSDIAHSLAIIADCMMKKEGKG